MTSFLVNEDVAAILHVSPRQVNVLASTGRLRGSKPGRRWLFDPDDVADYIADGANTTAPRRRRRRAS